MDIILGKEEKISDSKMFTTNLILGWLKTEMAITNKRLAGHSPNTLLGIIPMGRNDISYPLKNIASVSIKTKLHIIRLIIGFALFVYGLDFLSRDFLPALIVTLIGIALMLNGFTSQIVVFNNSGQKDDSVQVSILEKGKAKQFVNEVNQEIADNA